MAYYKIQIKLSAAKELEGLPKPDLQRITKKIQSLAENPRPIGVEKLTGRERYRIRQGNYRILYEIYDREILVVIVKIGHRRDVYR